MADIRINIGLEGVPQVQAGAATAARSLGQIGAAGKLTGRDLTQVSAQLQDFFIQLQGGQSPITAFLQQGSQLATVFGGVGNAARALGAAAVSALNPLTLIAAAGAATAFAYKKGTDEIDAYNRALVLSGNIAGTTVGRLQDLAKAQSGLAGTQGKAAEFLTQLAASGKVASSVFGQAADAAIRLERASGPAIEETAKKLIALGKDPLQALLALNDAENFLSVSTYNQVRALVIQRKEAEAAVVAQRAYLETAADRAAKLEAQLGLLQKGWRAVGDVAKKAWDSMLNIGRPETPEEKITRAAEALAQARGVLQRDQRNRGPQAGNPALLGANLGASQSGVDTAVARYRGAVAGPGYEALSAFYAADAQKQATKTIEETELRLALAAAGASAAFEKASVRITGEIDHIQSKLRQGLILEIDALGQTSAKRIDLLRARISLLGAELNRLRNTPKTEEQQVRVQGQISAVQGEIKNEQQALQDAIAERIQRQQIENLRAILDLRQQIASETADDVKRQGDAYADQIARQQQQLETLQDASRLIDAEAGLVSATNERRERTLAILREQIRLEREIEQIKKSITADVAYDAEGNPTLDYTRQQIAVDRARQASQIAQDNIYRQQYLQAWERTNKAVGDTLLDALTGAGESARRRLYDLFTTLVLRPTLEPFVRPLTNLLSGALTDNAFGAGGGINGGAGQGTGSALSWISAGKALYDGFSTGFASIGQKVSAAYLAYSGAPAATNASTIAAAAGETGYYGASAASQAGAGTYANAATAGKFASSVAGIAAGVYGGRAISGGYAVSGSGNAYVNAGTAIGEAIGLYFGVPGVGGAIGGAIGGALNRVFGRKAPEVESQVIEGVFTGANFTGGGYANIVEKGGLLRSDKRYQEKLDITDLDKALDQGAQEISDLARKYGDALGLPVERLSTVTTQLKVEVGKADTPEQLQQAFQEGISKALAQYADALLESFADEVEPFRKAGETVAQVIERLGASLLDVNEVLKGMGVSSLAANVEGAKAATTLTDLFGGINNLASAGQSYYQKFFTDTERISRATAAYGAVFNELSLSTPKTRQEFRALVEAQDKTTESGLKAFAALLQVADAFDLVVTAADKAAQELSDAISRNIERLLSPEQYRTYRYNAIAGDLGRAGVAVTGSTLEGLSKEEVLAFAQGFVQLTNVSTEAKIAVVNAAGAIAELKDEAADAAQKLAEAAEKLAKELADRLRGIARGVDSVIGDFLKGPELATYYATRVQDLLKEGGIDSTVPGILGSTRADITRLWAAVGVDGREAILSAYDAWTKLQDVLYGTSKAVAEYRKTTLADAIEEARLRSLSPAARVARLKNTEASLFAQLSTAEDPIAVSEKLRGVISERLSEESRLREDLNKKTIDGLNEQIDAAEKLKQVIAGIPQFVGELKVGDSSPLSRRQQLTEARTLFESTLIRAQGGDETAVGNLQRNAQLLIDEAVRAYGSGAQAAAIFNFVTTSLEKFAKEIGPTLDPQIEKLQAQISLLENLDDTSTEMLDALTSIDRALGGRFSSTGATGATANGTTTVTETGTNGVLTGVTTANSSNTAADLSSTTATSNQLTTSVPAALLVEQMRNVVTNTARLEQVVSGISQQTTVDRTGFTQMVERQLALEALFAQLMAGLRLGPALVG